MATTTNTVNAAMDHHLARLDALHQHLANPSRPPPDPDPDDPQTTPANNRPA
ncbi:hypothetical protein ACFCX4_06455 [Kitasatospora sp. NPDC056327]|uniref:hypothetical protein n=1 Tax=Kitasatospora sp. NPDC056327 TaxID=3345785 RepID=UPI0035E0A8C2